LLLSVAALVLAALAAPVSAQQAAQKPNILVIMGDDIGAWNVSAYHRGMVGGSTPNIDRLAKEGGLFMTYYGQASCTAGRAAFITGQYPIRTGLSTIGAPGDNHGIQPQDPEIAEILKPLGYTCGQFGKNHLGDLDQFLPTKHGFDEFFGNLYHLNAEQMANGDPQTQYPQSEQFKKNFGPRGVIHAYADGRVEDTGPLTWERSQTVDDEVLAHTTAFLDKAVQNNKPFFVWYNTVRTHVWTTLPPQYAGKTGYGLYADAMAQHDDNVGKLLKYMDDKKLMDNTIIIYTTDNGVEKITWPDGGVCPWRGEKGESWEGGFRVPALIRWPGHVKPGTVYTEITSSLDWFPTLCAAAGAPGIVDKLVQGYQAGDKNFKVHLDGYDLTAYLEGKGPSPRKEFFYWTEKDLEAVRFGDWKALFIIEPTTWMSGKTHTTWPMLFNLAMDPFEHGMEAGLYARWAGANMWTYQPVQRIVGQHLMTFKDFPPRQPPTSLNIDAIMEQMKSHQTQH
jgi:arylsulfatase